MSRLKGTYKHSEETKKKIGMSNSLVLKGRKLSEEHRKNMSIGMKGGNSSSFKKGSNLWIGKKHSEESKKKMSESKKGKIGYWKNKERPKMKNENHWNWKNGRTDLRRRLMCSYKYRQWRSDVFTRDNYTCQECNLNHCYLEAHHIKEFNKIIEENNIKLLDEALNCEELWNINNGITLCNKCHNKTKNGRK